MFIADQRLLQEPEGERYFYMLANSTKFIEGVDEAREVPNCQQRQFYLWVYGMKKNVTWVVRNRRVSNETMTIQRRVRRFGRMVEKWVKKHKNDIAQADEEPSTAQQALIKALQLNPRPTDGTTQIVLMSRNDATMNVSEEFFSLLRVLYEHRHSRNATRLVLLTDYAKLPSLQRPLVGRSNTRLLAIDDGGVACALEDLRPPSIERITFPLVHAMSKVLVSELTLLLGGRVLNIAVSNRWVINDGEYSCLIRRGIADAVQIFSKEVRAATL